MVRRHIKYRADGRKYRGFWSDGKQNGTGEFFSVGAHKWKKGQWNNGRRIKWIETEDEETL